jgi:hypothetical protein
MPENDIHVARIKVKFAITVAETIMLKLCTPEIKVGTISGKY